MRSPTVRWQVAAAVALSVFVALLALGSTIATRTEWQARATALLEPAPGVSDSMRSYVYDLSTREDVKATYEAMLRNLRFRREASEGLGLPDSVHQTLKLEVRAAARDATITVTAVSPEPAVAEQMAQAVLESARTYIDPLNGVFVLRVARPATAAQAHVRLSPPAAMGLILCAGGLAVLSYAGTRAVLSRIHRTSPATAAGH